MDAFHQNRLYPWILLYWYFSSIDAILACFFPCKVVLSDDHYLFPSFYTLLNLNCLLLSLITEFLTPLIILSPPITNLPNLVLIDGEKEGDGISEISSSNLKKLLFYGIYAEKKSIITARSNWLGSWIH